MIKLQSGSQKLPRSFEIHRAYKQDLTLHAVRLRTTWDYDSCSDNFFVSSDGQKETINLLTFS